MAPKPRTARSILNFALPGKKNADRAEPSVVSQSEPKSAESPLAALGGPFAIVASLEIEDEKPTRTSAESNAIREAGIRIAADAKARVAAEARARAEANAAAMAGAGAEAEHAAAQQNPRTAT